jgi:type III secretion protein J
MLTHKLVTLFFCLLLCACGSRVELLQGVSESEANEALAALLDGGIKAGKLPGKEGFVGLDVDSADVARAIAILRTEGLPKERYAKMGEVFRKEGLISSPLEERARYLWALSQELSATVAQIDGVIKARVHVVLPERSSGGDAAVPSSAAVFIKYKTGINLDDAVPQVKRLVANSIPGLSVDKVTVILLAAGVKTTEEAASEVVLPPQNLSKDTMQPLWIWTVCGLFIAFLSGFSFMVWRKWGKQITVKSSIPATPSTRSKIADTDGTQHEPSI